MAEHHRACASCGTANEEDARFCDGCGAALSRSCGTCGVKARAAARFCRACGAALDESAEPAPDSAAAPSRKTVTVMFADLAGSTSFEERVDAETAREVMSRYHDILRSTAERNRAGMTKYIGDGFMAVWGVPEIGPDDAGRAVDTAVELQERFVDFATRVSEAHGVDLALRVAVNTGEVVVGVGDADLVGDALNVAARLESECPRGHVVVGGETWRSTRGRHRYESLGQVQVKGRTEPVAVYQWLGRQSDATDAAPFVGRADEVRRLQAVLSHAVAARAARLVTVIGDPGVGKSRLAAEFTGAQGDSRVVDTRCDVQGTVALAPIVEVLRARDLETDVPATTPERDRILRDLNGLTAGVPGSVEETFWALRRYVEVLASDGPLIIVADDIQWADMLMLDFVEHLVEWVQDVPVLVLALARPELREARPDLVTVSRWVTEAVHLGGLDPGATAELAAGVLGAARLPEELVGRLPSSTGGNPLFVRELVGMLVHDGVLVAEPAGWRLTIDVDAIAIPPTIQALLASRLERLNAADRRVLEIASVVGTDFSLGAVCALTERSSAEVKGSLDRLRRLELAQPSGAYLGNEPLWRFHHVLIRDVAYRRLLKSDRADLHQQLADWIEAGGASVAFDPDEMTARHLEAAHGYRCELGTLDEHSGGLALRAARCYLSSARRALDRDELVSAGTQAARGAALAGADEAVQAELLLIGCEAFLSAGDVAAGASLVDDLDRIASEALAPWATCYRCQFVVYTDPTRLPEVDARLQGAIDEFGSRRDPAGLAKAHRVRASARARLGRVGDMEVDLFEALIAARQGGDHRQITAALGAAPSAALWGPSPVPKAGGRCLDVVRMQRMTTAAPSLEATSLRCLAVLELLRGRPDKARSMLADARQVVADLGLRHGLMETELFAGFIESMVGDQVAAEPHFRTAMEGMDALGAGADAGQAAALLARSVLAQGRVDEADRYAAESERLAGHNLKTAIAWRAARAEILAAQGRNDEAVAMANEAVAVAAGTDLVLDHAEACLALSRVLVVAGDVKGANDSRGDAERLYAAKEVATPIGRVVEPVLPAAPAPTAAMTRLAIANRASESVDAACVALQAHDVDRAVAVHSDRLVYEDRRRLSGDPIEGLAALRVASERLLDQYPHLDWRTLAVRGDRLAMVWCRGSDDAGNEATYFSVFEVGDDGQISHHVRFDGDDFDGAYRELEHRYYTGEGAAFAQTGHVMTDFIEAMNLLDVDAARRLSLPEFRWLAPPSTLTQEDRSIDEAFRWFQERARQVSSVKNFCSVLLWLSPTCMIDRGETQAIGPDGEEYKWSRIFVVEFRDGRVSSVRQFDDDEEAAFAYAEERMRATSSRLPVTNRASELAIGFLSAFEARDVDATVDAYADQFVFEDRRQLSGDPILDRAGIRAATERIFDQFSVFDGRTLAVRGERVALCWSRWSDDSGNETTYLHVIELGDDGRIAYNGRFDEDDFEGAYCELDRRYHAGEGAAFAEAGEVQSECLTALNRGDLDRVFSEFYSPGMRFEVRSRSAFSDRSAAELHASLEEFNAWVESWRAWASAICWVSPTCCVMRNEREAVGRDGEQYAWTQLYVTEIRDGRVIASCEFDIDDEEAAFAYAEERMRAASSRLALTNCANDVASHLFDACNARDVDAAVAVYADQFVYDDRRRLSGDPIEDRAGVRAAIERLCEQYSVFEARTLAVRGERLQLARSRRSDDAGNESTHLLLTELGDDRRIVYYGRFDEDDFEGAYRELERRYYAGEGAAFAEAGATTTEFVIALNRNDFDSVFDELVRPDVRVESRSRTGFPDRSAAELRAATEQLHDMVASTRNWNSAVCWLSPTWFVARHEREAVGRDGEQYEWTPLVVSEIIDGRLASTCDFDIEDEDAAFAYAEERVRATASRLAVTNRSCESLPAFRKALRAHDIDGVVAFYSDRFVYDDHRRLSGGPIRGSAEWRVAVERVLQQYNHFEWRILAARGDRLSLQWSRWSDDAGNETAQFHVFEIGDDRLRIYEGRFDEDDFEGAYRELERRYYAGEGAAFAEGGEVLTEVMIAMTQNDFERRFNEFIDPELQIENRSRSPIPLSTAVDLPNSTEQLNTMVDSVRMWNSAVCWLSPTWLIERTEREAVGPDGETYAWTYVVPTEIRDGRLVSIVLFDIEDEQQAFAYAEERMGAASSRLAVTNRSCEIAHAMGRAHNAHDADEIMRWCSDDLVFDDCRRLGGNLIRGSTAFRAAFERVLQQYSHFEWRILAVRGDRLNLDWTRWSDEAGNETAYLQVFEIGDDGRLNYACRFDEDDFEGAYRELERRYYAGEGAAFAEAGDTATEYTIALNAGDFDRMFGELTDPEMRLENRSRSTLPDRSVAEFRASVEELNAMVSSTRTWISAGCFLSPTFTVSRQEREAVGQDGELYSWTRLLVGEIRGGRFASMCEFDLEDEEAAFAYAEERVRAASSRLAVRNLASESVEAGWLAMHAHDVDAVVAVYSDRFEYDDRRRLSGGPRDTPAALRAAAERILEQYPQFEWRKLAVRGERLELGASRWWDDAGNETAFLHVFEIGDDGRVTYDGRFDEDDFESAYREFERRYYAGEGAPFAEAGEVSTGWITGLNRGDLDRIFDEFIDPELRVVNRSRSAFPDGSAGEFRATLVELYAMVASVRSWVSAKSWLSPACSVARWEREAVGRDGEQYAWARIMVTGFRDRRVVSMCEFDIENEEAAFAYAEEQVRAAAAD